MCSITNTSHSNTTNTLKYSPTNNIYSSSKKTIYIIATGYAFLGIPFAIAWGLFGRGGFVVAVGGVEGDGGVGEHLVHGMAAHHFGGGAGEHLDRKSVV